MINKVNNVGSVNFQKISFKSDEKVSNPQEQSIKKYDAEANLVLGNYNKASINMNKLPELKPLMPTVMRPETLDIIPGEKIYTSSGKLHSIVRENDNTKTIYTIDENNGGMISNIKEEDKATGKVIWSQINEIEGDKYKEMYIRTFDPETGDEKAFTCYENGKPLFWGKTVKFSDGSTVTYENNSNGRYCVTSEKENVGYSSFSFNKESGTANYNENFEIGSGMRGRSIDFYKGRPISINETRERSIPNSFAQEILNDDDLVPAPKMNVKNIESVLASGEGKETYYSNGVLESKTVVNNGITSVLKYSPDGKLESIKSDNAEIKITEDSYSYVEKLEDGAERETFRGDSMIRVSYSDEDKSKQACYDLKTGNLISYSEFKKENGEEVDRKHLYFDKNGNLASAW